MLSDDFHSIHATLQYRVYSNEKSNGDRIIREATVRGDKQKQIDHLKVIFATYDR